MGGWNILDELDYYLRYKYGPWPLVLLIIAGVLVAAWFLWPKPPSAATVYVKVAVEGEGLVNGSRTLEYSCRTPCTVVLVSEPAEYWRLAYWMVNGTRAGSEPTLELAVKANTTVTAVFEKMVCVLRVEANATSAAALIDGRKVSLPFEAEFPCGSKVSVEPAPLEGYKALNGSSILTLESNITAKLLFERLCRVEVLGGELGVVYVDGRLVSSEAFYVERGSELRLEAPCVDVNETYKACPRGWNVTGSFELFGLRYDGSYVLDNQNMTVKVLGDLKLYPVVTLILKAPPGSVEGEVLVDGTPAEAVLIPAAKWMIIPFRGKYEYLGDGWWKLTGEPSAGYVLAIPTDWRTLKVKVKFTAYATYEGASVEVILRNDEIFHSLGYAFTEGEYEIIFNRDKISRYAGVDVRPGTLTEPFGSCTGTGKCGISGTGPAKKRSKSQFEGVQPFWLLVDVSSGELLIRIEVVRE